MQLTTDKHLRMTKLLTGWQFWAGLLPGAQNLGLPLAQAPQAAQRTNSRRSNLGLLASARRIGQATLGVRSNRATSLGSGLGIDSAEQASASPFIPTPPNFNRLPRYNKVPNLGNFNKKKQTPSAPSAFDLKTRTRFLAAMSAMSLSPVPNVKRAASLGLAPTERRHAFSLPRLAATRTPSQRLVDLAQPQLPRPSSLPLSPLPEGVLKPKVELAINRTSTYVSAPTPAPPLVPPSDSALHPLPPLKDLGTKAAQPWGETRDNGLVQALDEVLTASPLLTYTTS